MCKYCEYKPEKLKLYNNPGLKKLGLDFKRVNGKLFKIIHNNPSINLELSETTDLPCGISINIHINKNGKFYFNGSYHHYSESDRYYDSWDDDLGEGTFSPNFKDRATGFKYCPMCGRKLVK